MNRFIFCIMGPTASGKTKLAVDLVQRFPFEIISVDSAMVYRGMDIGTAKPGPDILKKAPHRLIDIRDPADAYSAADFRQDAIREIEKIFNHGKIPLLVGGTMLYFKALQQGLSDLPSANNDIRDKLQREGDALGWPAMHEKLAKIDPPAALRIHPHDMQRIQRALEVYELTGKTLTAWQQENAESPTDYSIFNIAVAPTDRSILHKRIEERFDQMLAQGFIDEVRSLFERSDLSLETPAIRSVGYRQVWKYLQGELAYEEMRNQGIFATRQFAKRQLTWLRSWPQLDWFNSEEPDLFEQVLFVLSEHIAQR